MKLTKKQTAALNQIIDHERCLNEKYNRGGAGLHPSREQFAITDGTAVVIFDEKPEGFPDAPEIELFSKYIEDYLKDDRGVLVEGVNIVEECKRNIREWKQAHNLGKPAFPHITLSTMNDKGNKVEAQFNAQLVKAVVEAVGTGAMVYLGKDMAHNFPYPCMMVRKKNWMEGEDDYRGFLLPCRPM